MSRLYNFSAGPATLPNEVLEQARDELMDWNGSGMSVMEMSHRGKEFMSIAERAEADLRELLQIPNDYRVLFLQGGAAGQFSFVPMNLLGDKETADYLLTGHWSQKAIKEAALYCHVNVVASNEDNQHTDVPAQTQWHMGTDAAYFHYTPNETIAGVEIHDVPQVEGPIVADMSSTVLSRPIDVSRFALIYAGAQKNIGPAGLTLVIIREDLAERARADTPSVFCYKKQIAADSMLNTPPTYSWYLAGLVFQWLKRQGGLQTMAERNQRKAQKLYATIDASDFYHNPVAPAYRSWMNIPFTLANPELDSVFLEQAKQAGLLALKGHRSVEGMRASIYNAMPEEGVNALVEFMSSFEQQNA